MALEVRSDARHQLSRDDWYRLQDQDRQESLFDTSAAFGDPADICERIEEAEGGSDIEDLGLDPRDFGFRPVKITWRDSH